MVSLSVSTKISTPIWNDCRKTNLQIDTGLKAYEMNNNNNNVAAAGGAMPREALIARVRNIRDDHRIVRLEEAVRPEAVSRIDPDRRIRIDEVPYTVETLAQQYGEEIRVPDCQRELSWKGKRGLAKKQRLVDSVMHGYPIPSIILNRISRLHDDVYDGRHRIHTFHEYRNDKFTWNGAKYSQLCEDDRAKFDERRIPVTIVRNASPQQLADIFIRLNSGVALKDYDYLRAHRASPLVTAAVTHIMENARLATALGYASLERREDLANWTALACGLSTGNPGNITTSWIRLSDYIYEAVNEDVIRRGVEAICVLLERANEAHPAQDKERQWFKRIGRLLAYFVAEYLATPDNDTIQKWVGVIGRLRGNAGQRYEMTLALTTTGAQNLTETKIRTVLDQVNTLLETGVARGGDDYDDDESED